MPVWTEPNDEILGAIEEFLTGTRSVVPPDRVLVTVLFTDIVGATDRAVEVGDKEWRRMLDSHDAVGASLVSRQGGRIPSKVTTTGWACDRSRAARIRLHEVQLEPW